MSNTNCCKALAIFIDSTTTVRGNIPKRTTVNGAVGRMLPDLANQVSELYDLPTPLDSDTMTAIHFPSSQSYFLSA